MHLSSKEPEAPGIIIGRPVVPSLTLPADVVVGILVVGAEDSATAVERKKCNNIMIKDSQLQEVYLQTGTQCCTNY